MSSLAFLALLSLFNTKYLFNTKRDISCHQLLIAISDEASINSFDRIPPVNNVIPITSNDFINNTVCKKFKRAIVFFASRFH